MSWNEWNRRGLIPGPCELEQDFVARATKALRCRSEALDEAIEMTRRLYGAAPDFLAVTYSNEGLWPWHGAALVEQEGQIRLQLRKRLQRAGRIFWFYSHKEILAHELVHLGRATFHEPRYEEFFAYRTSPYWWRRLLGPALSQPQDALLFCLGVIALPWIGGVSGLAVGGVMIRFLWRASRLRRAWRTLSSLVGERAWELLYRLGDRDIDQLAQMSSFQAAAYIASQTSFHWRFLRKIYFR